MASPPKLIFCHASRKRSTTNNGFQTFRCLSKSGDRLFVVDHLIGHISPFHWARREQGSSSKAKVLHWQFFKTGSRVVQLYTLSSRILLLLLSIGIQEPPPEYPVSERSFIESVGLHLPSSIVLPIGYWSALKLVRDFRWKLALCFASCF